MKTHTNKWIVALVALLAAVAGGEGALLYRAHQERMQIPWSNPWLGMNSRDPFAGVTQMENDMNRLFGAPPPAGMFAMNRSFAPQLEMKDGDKAYTITAALPGFDKSDLNVTVDDGVLNVTGSSDGTHRFGHSKQREAGQFQSSIALPEQVDPSRMKATYRHGMLKIIVPKNEPVTGARKVAVR